MKYFVVLLPVKDPDHSQPYRPDHLKFLDSQRAAGTVFANGRFMDGSGGMVIYQGETLEEVENVIKQDPFIVHQVRDYVIREWEMVREN